MVTAAGMAVSVTGLLALKLLSPPLPSAAICVAHHALTDGCRRWMVIVLVCLRLFLLCLSRRCPLCGAGVGTDAATQTGLGSDQYGSAGRTWCARHALGRRRPGADALSRYRSRSDAPSLFRLVSDW